jgi:hypothetical protein
MERRQQQTGRQRFGARGGTVLQIFHHINTQKQFKPVTFLQK